MLAHAFAYICTYMLSCCWVKLRCFCFCPILLHSLLSCIISWRRCMHIFILFFIYIWHLYSYSLASSGAASPSRLRLSCFCICKLWRVPATYCRSCSVIHLHPAKPQTPKKDRVPLLPRSRLHRYSLRSTCEVVYRLAAISIPLFTYRMAEALPEMDTTANMAEDEQPSTASPEKSKVKTKIVYINNVPKVCTILFSGAENSKSES